MYYPPQQAPMMPLAHMMNNPMQQQMVNNLRKPDFPSDMQPIFVIPQIAHIKSQLKPKCRGYESVIGKGRNAEWMVDKFEEEDERIMREEREKDIIRPSRVPIKILKKIDKKRAYREDLQRRLYQWNPFTDDKITSDPYKTLFIGRLNYATTEKKLRKHFEEYGTIKQVRIVRNGEKARGYAFIEFEQKTQMKQAYKYAVGKYIDDKEVTVDIERGRTIMKWRPRRLGGGLGNLRRSRSEEPIQREQVEVVKKTEKPKKASRSRSAPKKKHRKREESEKKKNKHEKSKKKHK